MTGYAAEELFLLISRNKIAISPNFFYINLKQFCIAL